MQTPTSGLLWVRCGSVEMARVAESLKARLTAGPDLIDVIATGPGCQHPNPRGERQTTSFIATEKPSGLLWLGGKMDNACLSRSIRSGLAVGLADIGDTQAHDLSKPSLLRRRRFDKIKFVLTQSDESRFSILRLRLPENAVERSGPIVPDNTILPHDEDERAEIARALGTRPAWLATDVTLSDVEMLAAAHKIASRAAHRLLMLVVSKDPEDALTAAFETHGLRVGRQSDGADPRDIDQVFVAMSEDELGLFIRLATFCFLCGSFRNGPDIDPNSVAALGCALICGPAFGEFDARATVLRQNAALYQIETPDALGTAVTDLLSVDRTAQMAHAGWDVATSGFKALGRLEELTRTHLLRT